MDNYDNINEKISNLWIKNKQFIEEFIQTHDISYGHFLKIINFPNTSYNIHTLKNINDCFGINIQNKNSNKTKIFIAVNKFIQNFGSDEEFKNKTIELINQISLSEKISYKFDECFGKIIEKLGFSSVAIINFDETTKELKLMVNVDIFKFDTEKYLYGKSKNPIILEMNKKTLSSLLTDELIHHKIINNTINVNVIENINTFHTIRFR